LNQVTPYHCAFLSARDAELYNGLFRKNTGLAFQLGAHGYAVHLEGRGGSKHGAPAPFTAHVRMDERIGFDLYPEEDMLAMMLADIVTMEELKALPEEIRGIALEASLENVLDRIDGFSGAASTISRVSEKKEPDPMGMAVDVTLVRKNDGTRARGRIQTDAAGLEWIAAMLGRLPAKVLKPFTQLPVCGRIEIGGARLSMAEINSLEFCDILLSEDAWTPDNPEIRIRFSPGLVLTGNWVQPNRILIQGVTTDKEKTNKMTQKNKNTEGRSDLPVGDIPVRLVFEIGQTEVLMGELQQLQPGYTFKLDESLDLKKPVTIKANGVALGMGEIVHIDDRLGIRILTFNLDDNQDVK
jgi:type III secretion system YscQ/HrcQ family protein